MWELTEEGRHRLLVVLNDLLWLVFGLIAGAAFVAQCAVAAPCN